MPVRRRLFFEQPLWRNFFENPLTVQFNHRMMAYALFCWLALACTLVDVARTARTAPCERALARAGA